MQRFNVFDAELEYDHADPSGYRAGMARFGSLIGATMLGGTVYELLPARATAPTTTSTATRSGCWCSRGGRRSGARGEDELAPGDVVCFSVGADGAHKLTNRTETNVRVLMLSTRIEPAVAVYPDSDKIGAWPGHERDFVLVRRESVVDYWDREL